MFFLNRLNIIMDQLQAPQKFCVITTYIEVTFLQTSICLKDVLVYIYIYIYICIFAYLDYFSKLLNKSIT